MPTPLAELLSVSKSFGATRALSDVSFDVCAGEVHVLAGENGAGKSTLIRILSGALTDFDGELRVAGVTRRFRSPDDATSAGIATIHQELSLVESLSVLDNLFLGEARSMFSAHSQRARLADAQRVLQLMDLELDARMPVESLPLSVRQLVEIARALGRDAKVLVMDEPTSALSEPDVKRLFTTIRRLKNEGRGIVFISHRLEEIFKLADRITVLRDGARVLSEPAPTLDSEKLVRAMVGRDLGATTRVRSRRATNPLLEVRGLGLVDERSGRPILSNVSFELGAGEVVGVAGLRGSGATELLHALIRSTQARFTGEVSLQGASYLPRSPLDALRAGVVLLASDRRTSVLSQLSVRENGSLSSLDDFSRWGFVDVARERIAVARTAKRVSLSASLEAPASQLSGGNQQKVALTRCLLGNPKLLLCDEPTRGIDVAAKADVHALIRELADSGLGILFTSSELDELAALSNRVLVFFRGRLLETLPAGQERATILRVAMGASA